MNLVQEAVERGGKLTPLIIPAKLTGGQGLLNPSVFVDHDGEILCIVRSINYTLYHAEDNMRFPSHWGPLSYLHPESDPFLRTENYLCRLDKNYNITHYTKIEMLQLHEPIWEFVGLEDARLFQWYGQLYMCGVRRDTTPNGVGRMELCPIFLDKENWTAKEIQRERIEVKNVESYLEKNWMPILDHENTFIKWSNPTEVVEIRGRDSNQSIAKVISLKEGKQPPIDQRGGSQVIKWGDYWVAITHETVLFKTYLGQKNGQYRHRLMIWNDSWELIGFSPESFSFMDGQIEFCAGLAVVQYGWAISFGFQDNCAFVLEVPHALIGKMVAECLR